METKKKKRDYGNKYPSVTTILGILRNIPLEYWFKVNTLEFINKESSKGKLIGTDIHDAIEYFVLTGEAKVETEYVDDVTNALKSFMLFRRECPDLVLKWAETPLTSEKYKFNGTIDCVGEGIILDWKSGNAKDEEKPSIYDSYKVQVSAYVNLYNEVNNTNIDKALIVSIAKDKIAYNIYELSKQEIDGQFNEVFLPALRILNYQRKKEPKDAL